MRSLDQFARAKLAELDARHLRRRLAETTREDGIWVARGGKRLLSFSCNDYLNLTQHPEVKAAAIAAIEKYGAGAGASRLVTGNHPLYAVAGRQARALERNRSRLRVRLRLSRQCWASSRRWSAKDDLVLVDELAHACLWAGARLSGATVAISGHNDVGHAEELLTVHRPKHRRALIATDGVFSMDGDLAPLTELAALAERFDAWLMSDDAHGLGVVGGGAARLCRITKPTCRCKWARCPRRWVAMAVISAPRAPVIDLIKTRARTLIYSTGLPPATVAAAIAALDIIERESGLAARCRWRRRRPSRATAICREAQSAIVPVVIGDETAALEASQHAGRRRLSRPSPSVRRPCRAGTARLRFAFTAGHPDDEIERLADIVRDAHSQAQCMSAFFVTATGTDIGKTFVTAGLIRHLRAARQTSAAR